MVSVLTKIFGTENLQLAEDVVQDTFVSAMQTWRLKGIPDNPAAWLSRSARNKAIDLIRRSKFSTRFDFEAPERQLLKSGYTLSTVMDSFWTEESIQDDLLRMMYACCEDGISEENQITLILKTLCGFSTAEIAKAFLSSEDTISKRLYRSKEFFRERKTRLQFPEAALLQGRTHAVLRAIYLIFNEGYNSTHSDALIRQDLLEQAMYLCKLLCDNPHTQLPEVFAAMALMCLHAARTDSRLSQEGEIILLADQDRGSWKQDLIARGNAYLNAAAFGGQLSTYHVEAAIAYEHCTAADFASTNWERILQYYDWLMRLAPSGVVALNRLAVVYKLNGRGAALAEIAASPYRAEWEKHYLYHSLCGEMAGDKPAAKQHYEAALQRTQSETEKRLLRKRIEGLEMI